MAAALRARFEEVSGDAPLNVRLDHIVAVVLERDLALSSRIRRAVVAGAVVAGDEMPLRSSYENA